MGTDIRPIGAVIEKQTNEPPFLPDHPWDMLARGEYNKVPFMIGYTNAEAMLYDLSVQMGVAKKERFCNDFEQMVPYSLDVPQGSELSKKIGAKIKEFYAGNEELNENNIQKDYKVTLKVLTFYSLF